MGYGSSFDGGSPRTRDRPKDAAVIIIISWFHACSINLNFLTILSVCVIIDRLFWMFNALEATKKDLKQSIKSLVGLQILYFL